MTTYQYVEQALHGGIVEPLLYLLNPERRIYLGYLLSAFVIGFFVFRFSQKLSTRDSLKQLLQPSHWFGKSAIVDYIFFFVGGFTKILFVIPYLSLGTVLAFWLSDALTHNLGIPSIRLTPTQIAILYPLTMFLVKDFFVYVAHYLLHRNKYLWQFHKVHHSAETLTPITLYRMHPVEVLIQNLQGLLAFVLVTGIFYYFNTGILARATIFGVNAFSFVFFMLGANLRHSHVPFRYPRFIDWFAMSPFQHQIHHDSVPRHCHSNFGSRLALWDYMFGTLRRSHEVNPADLKFGLPEKDRFRANTFVENLLEPFKACFRIWRQNKQG